MDGENNASKPYEQMDDLGGPRVIFGNTQLLLEALPPRWRFSTYTASLRRYVTSIAVAFVSRSRCVTQSTPDPGKIQPDLCRRNGSPKNGSSKKNENLFKYRLIHIFINSGILAFLFLLLVVYFFNIFFAK